MSDQKEQQRQELEYELQDNFSSVIGGGTIESITNWLIESGYRKPQVSPRRVHLTNSFSHISGRAVRQTVVGGASLIEVDIDGTTTTCTFDKADWDMVVFE